MKGDETPEDSTEPAPFLRIIKYTKGELRYYLAGMFGSCITGTYPFLFAFLLSEILAVRDIIKYICAKRTLIG